MMKILPIPCYFVFGPGARAALYAYVVLIPVFCVYLFLAVRALFAREDTALVAVIITCSFPLVYGMWRNTMTEFGSSVAVVAAIYHLIRSEAFHVRKHVILFGIFFGWSLLWKISGPVFLLGPMLYVLLRQPGVLGTMLQPYPRRAALRPEFRPLVRNSVFFLVTVLLVAGPFYLKSGRAVLRFAVHSVLPKRGNELWSLGPVLSPKTFVLYWLSHINWGISFYFFVLLTALVV